MKLLIHYYSINSFEYNITIDMLIKEQSTTKLIDRQIPWAKSARLGKLSSKLTLLILLHYKDCIIAWCVWCYVYKNNKGPFAFFLYTLHPGMSSIFIHFVYSVSYNRAQNCNHYFLMIRHVTLYPYIKHNRLSLSIKNAKSYILKPIQHDCVALVIWCNPKSKTKWGKHGWNNWQHSMLKIYLPTTQIIDNTYYFYKNVEGMNT